MEWGGGGVFAFGLFEKMWSVCYFKKSFIFKENHEDTA